MYQGRYRMVDSRTDNSISKVLGILKDHPDGLSITNLAALLSMNRNTASKYLGILQRQGSIDMRQVGVAKVYYPTRRLQVAAVRRLCSQNLVVDHNLKILEASGALAALAGTTPEALIGTTVQTLLLGPDSSGDVIPLLRKALRGEEGNLIWRPAGTRGPVCRFSLIPTVLESGRPAVSLVAEKLEEENELEEAQLLEALRRDQTEGIVRVSPDGRVRWANDAYCRMVGKSRDNLSGKPFQPPLSAGGGAAWKEFVRGLTPDSPTATIDCGMVAPDGSTRWYRWRGRALYGADGKAIEHQYLCFTIHECRMLEDSLRRLQQSLKEQADDRTTALWESEERFRAVFDGSPVGIASCSMDGTLVRVNRVFLAIFGARSWEEIEGRNAFTFLNIPHDVLPCLKGGETVGFAIPYSGKNAPDFSADPAKGPGKICLKGVASPVLSREGGAPSGFVLQFCNVTRRQRAGAAAREAESRYRNLFETLAEGVVYLDRDGRITDANPAAERILGYSFSNMQDRTFSELRWRVIDEDGSAYLGDLPPHMVALTTGIPERKTLGIFNPRERRYRWLDILAVPRFQPGEAKPFQVVTIFSDITGQKEIEEAQLDTERRYRALTESLPDVVFLLDPDGHLLYVNSLGARMLHRLPEEVIGKFLPDLFKDRGVQYRLNVASAAATGTIKDNISRLQLPGGEVWYDTRLIPVSAQDGTCRYVMGIARDVTAQVQAKEVSQKNAERFRSVFEESPDGIAVCDPDGLLLQVNQACLELLGIAHAEEILGTNLLEVFRVTGFCGTQPPGDAVTRFECCIDFDRIRSRDTFPTTRTGSIHIGGIISPLRPPESGSPDGYLVQIRDITDQILAEEALREFHDRLAGIARHLPDAMFAIDRKGVVTVWNPEMENLTGILAEEMLGKGNYEYALPFYGKRTPMLVDKVLKPGEALQNRYRSITYAEGGSITAEALISPGGNDLPRIWRLKAAPLYDDRGEVAGAVEYMRDVTEQRRGEDLSKREKAFTNTVHDTR